MRFDRACAETGAWAALRTCICVFGAALAVTLGGCSASTLVSAGTPVTTVTAQATGDFSSYTVGLDVYSLTRKDGYVVYPSNYGSGEEDVDLTKTVDLTELLSALGLTTGTYTSATITIDYSNAAVFLKGQSTAAKVQNSSGSNPGSVNVTVKFDPADPLVITQSRSTRMAIDVDLAASNSIDQSTNIVTVSPFLVATAQPTDTAPIRARGTFVYVDANTGFTENIRPFDDSYYGSVGALTVNTGSSTYFDIDGTPYVGSAGLSAMAAQSKSAQLNNNSTIVAYGTLGSLSTITPTFNATQVYIGTSVVSPGGMEVRGIVTARSGDSLTLRGADYICLQGQGFGSSGMYLPFTHFETAKVNVGPSTKVTEDGTARSGLSSQSISVGQQIYATGQTNLACPNTSNSTASLTLDATSGEVRLQPTTLWGTLNSGAAGSATLALQQIGLYAPGNFTFSGTGISSANDANPASYLVNTGTVDESATPQNTLLRADGIVTPFGSAPPDFTAASVATGASEPATLIVEWKGGTTAPFSAYGNSGLVVNLGNSSIDTAIIRTGPQAVQLTSLPSSPSIVPGCQSGSCATSGEFAIGNATKGISEFNGASGFLNDLTSTLNGSTAVFKLVAIGSYDSSSNTFYSQRIDVALE